MSGPVHEPDPAGATVVRVESAREMLEACEAALPVDIAVCAAAVADWRVAESSRDKIKKRPDGAPPTLVLAENPDILKRCPMRPRGRAWSLVLLRKPATSSPMAGASSRPRVAIGSWPMTFRGNTRRSAAVTTLFN